MELHSLESHYWLPMTTTGLLPRRVLPTLTIVWLISSFRVGAPIVLLYPPSYICLRYASCVASVLGVLGRIFRGRRLLLYECVTVLAPALSLSYSTGFVASTATAFPPALDRPPESVSCLY